MTTLPLDALGGIRREQSEGTAAARRGHTRGTARVSRSRSQGSHPPSGPIVRQLNSKKLSGRHRCSGFHWLLHASSSSYHPPVPLPGTWRPQPNHRPPPAPARLKRRGTIQRRAGFRAQTAPAQRTRGAFTYFKNGKCNDARDKSERSGLTRSCQDGVARGGAFFLPGRLILLGSSWPQGHPLSCERSRFLVSRGLFGSSPARQLRTGPLLDSAGADLPDAAVQPSAAITSSALLTAATFCRA